MGPEIRFMNRIPDRPAALLAVLLAAALLTLAVGCSNDDGTTSASSIPTGSMTITTAAPTPTPSPGAATPSPGMATPSPGAATPSPGAPRTVGRYRTVNAYPGLSFDQPLYFTTAGDDSQNVFVVERSGRIRVFADRPDAAPGSLRTFLDLSSLVDLSGQEKGLLGLAFHPDYRTNGHVYVNYTNRNQTVIARYTRPSGSDTADPSTAQVLLTFSQPFSNHNGGHLAFGPDGFLYIASGDGGSGGDPMNNGQNLGTLLGKILRIDVDRPSDGRPYGIPADNPFAGAGSGTRAEIFAYGLRNPWRFSFAADGTLWAADVGQNQREEVDRIEKGGNYGWAALEGTRPYKTVAGVDPAALKPPVWEYDRTQGQSITGGYVYEGSRFPDLAGTYVYGDFGSGRIWALWTESGQVQNRLLAETGLAIASFGLDQDGELRVVDFSGAIHRLEPAG